MSNKNERPRRRNTLRLSGFDYAARRIYFVTIVTSNRSQVFLDRRLASATVECLIGLRSKIAFCLYSFCLMPEHLHALIGTGHSNKSLGEIVGAFKSLSTRSHWQWYEGRLWQRQFFDHIIRNDQDLEETWEYILNNPIRRGLESWPFVGSFHGPAF